MKTSEANIALIRHVTRCIDEFCYEHPAAKLADFALVRRAFSHFLREKDACNHAMKQGDGFIAQQVNLEDIVDEKNGTASLGFIKLFVNRGRVGLMWNPMLFSDNPVLMPDVLRKDLVELLRFHASKLEDRSLDERMREVAPKAQIGAA